MQLFSLQEHLKRVFHQKKGSLETEALKASESQGGADEDLATSPSRRPRH